MSLHSGEVRKVLSPDGWGSRVAPRGLGFDPLVGQILGLVKKIPSLCLIHSRVLSSACQPLAWAIAKWALVADPLVMGGQGSGVFSTGTYWFRDFLAIIGLCVPWVLTPGNVGEGGFPHPGRVFLHLGEVLAIEDRLTRPSSWVTSSPLPHDSLGVG
jgi:hypothetical protein